jgi:hypothetical protein
MGLFKHGFSPADFISYNMKYLTAYSYALKKNIEGTVRRLLKSTKPQFPSTYYGGKKKAASLWTKILLLDFP